MRRITTVHGRLRYCRKLRLAHRFIEKLIGLAPGLLGPHIIRGLEIDRVDLRQTNELDDFHVGRGLRQPGSSVTTASMNTWAIFGAGLTWNRFGRKGKRFTSERANHEPLNLPC